MKIRLAAATLALIAAGCTNSSDNGACSFVDQLTGACLGSATPTPTPAGLCPFQVGATPLRVSGAYFIKAEPAGTFTALVGAVVYGVPDEGIVVYGAPGDIVSACRPCGCALPVPLP